MLEEEESNEDLDRTPWYSPEFMMPELSPTDSSAVTATPTITHENQIKKQRCRYCKSRTHTTAEHQNPSYVKKYYADREKRHQTMNPKETHVENYRPSRSSSTRGFYRDLRPHLSPPRAKESPSMNIDQSRSSMELEERQARRRDTQSQRYVSTTTINSDPSPLLGDYDPSTSGSTNNRRWQLPEPTATSSTITQTTPGAIPATWIKTETSQWSLQEIDPSDVATGTKERNLVSLRDYSNSRSSTSFLFSRSPTNVTSTKSNGELLKRAREVSPSVDEAGKRKRIEGQESRRNISTRILSRSPLDDRSGATPITPTGSRSSNIEDLLENIYPLLSLAASAGLISAPDQMVLTPSRAPSISHIPLVHSAVVSQPSVRIQQAPSVAQNQAWAGRVQSMEIPPHYVPPYPRELWDVLCSNNCCPFKQPGRYIGLCNDPQCRLGPDV